MFTNLKPYPEYVDSGNQSVGRLPASWQTSRLRGVSRLLVSNVDKLTYDHEQPVRLCNYVDVYKNEFITDRPGYMTASASDDEIRRFRVRVDDVAITKDSESWTDIGVPAYVAHEADDLVCGYHLGLLRTRKDILSGAYLFRALQVPAIAIQFHVAAGGVTRYGLSQDHIRSASVPIPSLSEQAAIVKYLGHANARIDRAIAAKRKLIALLEEQKQAAINQAVTRGLDPTVPLKDSGTPWLGQIPAHWDVIPTGAATLMIQTGPFGSQLHAEEYIDGGVPVINPSHLSGTGIAADTTVSVSRSKAGELARHHLTEGDLIAARRGELGRCAVVRRREVGWICGTGSLIIRLRPEAFCPPYFQLLFSSQQTKAQLNAGSVGATMSNLSAQIVARLRIPKPELEEQRVIVDAVNSEVGKAARRIAAVTSEIELLREFRTRLTADIVTGQLDIRDAAARLPELDVSDLVSDIAEPDENYLDANLAENLAEVDA